MFRNLLTIIALGTILSCGLLPAAPTDGSNDDTKDQRPFADVAYIPAGADLTSIRFEKIRAVRVPSKVHYASEERYCDDLAFRDPGGSAFCPAVAAESPVAAYEVTYSFEGPSMASDESGARRFTFQVFFRPEDLPPQVRKAIPVRNRADIAEYLIVETRREAVSRTVIDGRQSSFCEGSYVDGNWTHRNADCSDNIVYKTVTVPSDFVAVRVDPISSRRTAAAIATSGR